MSKQFNQRKGSISPYYTPSEGELDQCSELFYKTLSSADAVMPPYASHIHDEHMHSIDDEIYSFWTESGNADDSKSEALIDASVEKFKEIMHLSSEAAIRRGLLISDSE